MRRDAGMFDVSHMCIVDLDGARVREFLRFLLANDVGKLTDSRTGAVLVHAAARGRRDRRSDRLLHDRVMVPIGRQRRHAPQGSCLDPRARGGVRRRRARAHGSRDARGPGTQCARKTAALLPPARRAAALDIPRFSAAALDSWFLARTGYTGEDGFEIMLPARGAAAAWQASCARRHARRIGCARYAAPGSRHESLRQRHGRKPPSARVRPGVDGRVRSCGARIHRP